MPITQIPEITLTKTGSFDDDNGDGNADVGETISYTFTVENTGNLTLTDITLSDADPNVTITGGPIASLAPGELDSTTFTGTYTVTQDDIDAGQKDNTATAEGKDPEDNDVSDDDTKTTALPQAPSLDITKEVSTDDNLNWDDDSVTVEEGAPVYFGYAWKTPAISP